MCHGTAIILVPESNDEFATFKIYSDAGQNHHHEVAKKYGLDRSSYIAMEMHALNNIQLDCDVGTYNTLTSEKDFNGRIVVPQWNKKWFILDENGYNLKLRSDIVGKVYEYLYLNPTDFVVVDIQKKEHMIIGTEYQGKNAKEMYIIGANCPNLSNINECFIKSSQISPGCNIAVSNSYVRGLIINAKKDVYISNCAGMNVTVNLASPRYSVGVYNSLVDVTICGSISLANYIRLKRDGVRVELGQGTKVYCNSRKHFDDMLMVYGLKENTKRWSHTMQDTIIEKQLIYMKSDNIDNVMPAQTPKVSGMPIVTRE